MRPAACGLALLLCCAGAAAAGQNTLQGRRLDDALRLLQHAGVPIVFSSEIVTPDMRVTAEPPATAPREQLDELLAPHGLIAQPGPGGVILVVRRPAAAPAPPRAGPITTARRQEAPASVAPAAPRATYRGHVTVTSSDATPATHGALTTRLNRVALRAAGGPLDENGLAAVDAMPRVTAVDDFRSDFSVRGSPYRQIGIVTDGVPTPWLQHTLYGRSNVGSLPLFGNDSLDSVTLQAGAYPRLYQDALGAQLDLSLREGSRESTRFSGTAGGMTTAVAGEGPIGAQHRGSWIAGFRNSYQTWPPGSHSQTQPGFLFADLHAKLVYDVSPRQQVSVTALGGRSTLDTLDELLSGPLETGTDNAGLLTAGWQSTLGSGTIVRQRLFLVGQDLQATLANGQPSGGSINRALGYRGEALHAMFGGLLEAGAEVSRLSGVRDVPAVGAAAPVPGAARATWMTPAAFADFSRRAPHGLSFEGGARLSNSTLVRHHALSPWLLGAWRPGHGWTIDASAGASRQLPDLDATVGTPSAAALLPERATHVGLGVERQFSNGMRWQATLFYRRERDVLRPPDALPRLVEGAMLDPPMPGVYCNAIAGESRGLELVVTSLRARRLSGWLSYTYAITRQRDGLTGETFWSDLDRRHTFNGAGLLRIGSRTTASVVLRAASGAPIPGYFEMRDGTLVVGRWRNTVRLPTYVRFDGRVQRQFFSSRHQISLFAEVVNMLNRGNVGLAVGTIQPLTGDAFGFSQSLAPRRASIGIQFSWSQ